MKYTTKKIDGVWGVFKDGVLLEKLWSRNAARNRVKELKSENETPPQPAGTCTVCGQPSDSLTYDHQGGAVCPSCVDAQETGPPESTEEPSTVPASPDAAQEHPPQMDVIRPEIGFLLRIVGDPNGWLGCTPEGCDVIDRSDATVYPTRSDAMTGVPIAARSLSGVSVEIVPSDEEPRLSWLLVTDEGCLRRDQPTSTRGPRYKVVPRHRATVFTRKGWAIKKRDEAASLLPGQDVRLNPQGSTVPTDGA